MTITIVTARGQYQLKVSYRDFQLIFVSLLVGMSLALMVASWLVRNTNA